MAYQGVPGAYSEMAALKACPGWEPLPCEQFETAFQALSQVSGNVTQGTEGIPMVCCTRCRRHRVLLR